MGFHRLDPNGHYVFELGVAQTKRFHLQTRHGQAVCDTLGRNRAVNIVGKPLNTYQHWSSPAPLKLLKKTQVVFKKQAKVVYSEFQHGYPLDSQAESKTGYLLRIIANVFVDLRVNHSRSQYLEPSGAFAYAAAAPPAHDALNIHLGARFGEREKTRPETKSNLRTEHLVDECGEDAFQIAKTDALAHHQALHLVKHWRMSDVRIAPVGPSGSYDPDRGLSLFHCPD